MVAVSLPGNVALPVTNDVPLVIVYVVVAFELVFVAVIVSVVIAAPPLRPGVKLIVAEVSPPETELIVGASGTLLLITKFCVTRVATSYVDVAKESAETAQVPTAFTVITPAAVTVQIDDEDKVE